jgi:hypothetical protein
MKHIVKVICIKNLSYTFPSQNGPKQKDALVPLLFNFVLEYTIKKVQENEKGLATNVTYQFKVSAAVPQKTQEYVVRCSKEIGIEINVKNSTAYVHVLLPECMTKSFIKGS